jgi:hypothetical protein
MAANQSKQWDLATGVGLATVRPMAPRTTTTCDTCGRVLRHGIDAEHRRECPTRKRPTDPCQGCGMMTLDCQCEPEPIIT